MAVPEPKPKLAKLIPTRQSLLSRLRSWDDSDAWQEFYEIYWRFIFAMACEAGLSPSDAEEVVQETLISVSNAIRNFHYDKKKGAFKAWLRNTTTWRIRDHLRRQQRLKAEPLGTAEMLGDEALSTSDALLANWDQAWERHLLDTALAHIKRTVSPNHYQVFDLAFMKEWPTQRIASVLGVRAAYVYLIKHRVACRVREEVKRLKLEQEHPLVLSAVGAKESSK